MFIELETERGEMLSVNTDNIIAYWTIKKNKVCVLLVNDLTYNLNCSYMELQSKLNGENRSFSDKN